MNDEYFVFFDNEGSLGGSVPTHGSNGSLPGGSPSGGDGNPPVGTGESDNDRRIRRQTQMSLTSMCNPSPLEARNIGREKRQSINGETRMRSKKSWSNL